MGNQEIRQLELWNLAKWEIVLLVPGKVLCRKCIGGLGAKINQLINWHLCEITRGPPPQFQLPSSNGLGVMLSRTCRGTEWIAPFQWKESIININFIKWWRRNTIKQNYSGSIIIIQSIQVQNKMFSFQTKHTRSNYSTVTSTLSWRHYI